METKKIVRSLLAVLIAVVFALCFFAACGGNGEPDDPDPGDDPIDTSAYEFVFTGSSSDFVGGRTLNVNIYGNKDAGQTFTLRVEEYPQVRINGTWVLEPNKGYKVYFEDATNTYEYCRFDDATNTFTFSYALDLGSTLGSATISFSYVDEDFVYDGIGLGRKPPVFTATDGTLLTCNEDGTFISGTRTGTWEYDEEADEYNFDFDFDGGYDTIFQLNEAWDAGYYCGYNRVDSVHPGDSSTGERQLEFPGTGADPICINIQNIKEGAPEYDMLPMNEPYKSAATTTDLGDGLIRVDVDVASLDDLEEIVADMEEHRQTYHGPEANNPVDEPKLLEHYTDLPAVWYVIDTNAGTYDFMDTATATFNEGTGAYDLIWEASNHKYQIHTGSYKPEEI